MKPNLKLARIEPSDQPLHHIQELLEGLRYGEYVGYLAVGIKPGGGCTVFTCAPTTGLIASIGAATILQADLLERMNRG